MEQNTKSAFIEVECKTDGILKELMEACEMAEALQKKIYYLGKLMPSIKIKEVSPEEPMDTFQ